MLFAVTFFYSFALLNGSLEKIALHSVYVCRSIPWAIPIMLYLLGFIMSGIGNSLVGHRPIIREGFIPRTNAPRT